MFTVVTVGFGPDVYEVVEDAGSVTLTIRLIDGVLERDVTVFFETNPALPLQQVLIQSTTHYCIRFIL